MSFSRAAISAGYTFCARQIRDAKDLWSYRDRSLEQAEGMACRICVDPPATGVDVERRCAGLEDLRVGLIEIGDVDVEVELLRVPGEPEDRHLPRALEPGPVECLGGNAEVPQLECHFCRDRPPEAWRCTFRAHLPDMDVVYPDRELA
jgi:hypothetical protein